MARAIDSEVAFRFLTEQLVKETGAFSKGVNKGLNIARSAMRTPDATPALPPLNKPLTLDELLTMDGEPVWVESIQEQQTQPEGWCVIGIFGRGRFLCALIPGDEDTPWESDTYGKCWLAYRRPPEGEEEA